MKRHALPRLPLLLAPLALIASITLADEAGATPPAPTAAATAVERIVWLMPEVEATAAPAPGASGPVKRGLAQPLADYLMANWGGTARHEVMFANVKRSWRMIENGEHGCHLGVLRTPEREAVAYFFDTHLIPPHQLVLRRAALTKLARNAAGEADLEATWAARQVRGAIVQGRSYGKALDALLARRPPRVLDEYTMPDFGGNMLAMIAIGRADYTIEYDFVLAQQQQLRASMKDLVSLPIQGFSEPVVSGVACPRNDWGRRAITQVERVLGTPQARQFMRDEFLTHLSPETRARYGPRIDAFYARPPGVIPPR